MVVLGASPCFALPLPTGTAGQTIDRKDFIPHRKHQQLAGKLIGVLVPSPQPILTLEGRSGPADQLCFAANGASYRWIYVQVEQNPSIGNIMLPVGSGKERKRFDRLSLATPATVKQFGLDGDYALVEVEVNDGLGSPPDDSFVASKMRRIDGTGAFPLKLPQFVEAVRNKYEEFQKDSAKLIDEGLGKAAEAMLKNEKPTGPREKEEVIFVSWNNNTERLHVRFRTRITDGRYQYAGGVNIELGPAPANTAKPGTAPPPRLPNGLRYGKQFGVEFGMAYEAAKDGKIVREASLPIETFSRQLPAPAIFDRAKPKK